jgi:DEAD/DEAH box helicase domain-containing protein
MMAAGRLRVTEQVTGYDRIQTRTGKVLERIPLDLPPMVFDTQGIWFTVPAAITAMAQTARFTSWAGCMPLNMPPSGCSPCWCWRTATTWGASPPPFIPSWKSPAIFIYDGLPGGAGICAQAFSRWQWIV